MKKLNCALGTLALMCSIVGLNRASLAHADNGSFTYLTTALPAATVGAPYSATVSFIYSGSGIPTVTAIGLPQGVYITPQGSPTIAQNAGIDSLTLNGVPTLEGNYPVVFAYNDQSDGATGSQSIALEVQSTFNINGFDNLVNGNSLPNGTAGSSYAFQFSVGYNGNGTPASSITGLPLGVTATPIYKSADGYMIDLKGTPGQAGDYQVELTLNDYTTTQTFPLTLAVYQAQASSTGTSTTPTTTPEASGSADSVGTNILTPDGTVSMIAGDGTRRPYTSAGAFLSYGFNSWSNVKNASSADISMPVGSFIPPRDGKIICSNKGSDMGTCYLITNGQKAGFTSAPIFTGLGFSFDNTMSGDVSWMTATGNISNTSNSHLPGTLINNNGTIELVTTDGVLGVPDMTTLASWGYLASDAVPANTADKGLAQAGVLTARQDGQLEP
jgi:hypothetical protein